MLITINIGRMVTAAPPATGADVHRALVADLREQLATAALGGSERSRARHVERGKLLPRDRVDPLVDPSARSSSCPRWPRTACTTATPPAPG